MNRFRPSQRTMVTFAIIFGLVAWSVLRTVELRRKDRIIQQLESQVRAPAGYAASGLGDRRGPAAGARKNPPAAILPELPSGP